MPPVGQKIRCAACSRELLAQRFSESSKRKYYDSLAKNKRNPKVPIKEPRCTDCSPGNRSEMTCVQCDQTMDLEQFSKAQRKKTDDAHCLNCQQEKDDREPDHDKEVEEVEIMSEILRQSQIGTSGSRYSRVTGSAPRSGLSQSEDGYLETETNPRSDSWAHGNHDFSLQGSDFPAASTVDGKRATGSGWDDFPGSTRDRSSRSIGGGRSHGDKFVKQNAVGKTAVERAQKQLDRNQDRLEQVEEQVQRYSSDDNDSDDDEELPY